MAFALCQLRRVVLVLFVLVSLVLIDVEGTVYTIQAIMPVSSAPTSTKAANNGQPNSLQLAQWLNAAQQAMTSINSAWNTSGNSLVMDILDNKGDQALNMQYTYLACSNASVLLVVHGGPDNLTTDTANIARFFNVRLSFLSCIQPQQVLSKPERCPASSTPASMTSSEISRLLQRFV